VSVLVNAASGRRLNPSEDSTTGSGGAFRGGVDFGPLEMF